MERAGLSDLYEGQQVEYDLVEGRSGKSSAENLTDFPLPYGMNAMLRAESIKRGSTDYPSLRSGQAVALNRAMPAAALVRQLAEEAARFGILGDD